MERVGTLLQKLQKQYDEGKSAGELLLTVQMLHHELAHLQINIPPSQIKESVITSMPLQVILKQAQNTEITDTEERTVSVLQVDEEEVAAELEEIKRNAAVLKQISAHTKPGLLFDPSEDDIPTLAQYGKATREINQSIAQEISSINERLKEVKTEVSEKLTDSPVKDLRKAIGINDRYLFINELFRGDEAMYERSIKTINGFSIWPEAEYWIRRELKTKLGWSNDNDTVKIFDQLVKRRFS